MDISILSLVLIIALAIGAFRIIAFFAGLFGRGRAKRSRLVPQRGNAPFKEQPPRREGYGTPSPHPLPPPGDDVEYWQAAHQALQHRMPPPAPPPRPHGD